jgi:GTP-binding protein
VIFEVRRNLRTLTHLRYRQVFKAENGRDGEGRGRYGRQGEDAIIPVPPGSVLRDMETGELIRDFNQNTGSFRFLRGGNGGWGNIHFKSSINQAPRKALPGEDGQIRRLKVELRIIADIGFVGFPNAGKSSLLDHFTNARPKIAAYPFTTKIPNLGVLSLGGNRWEEADYRDIILADIPGIIEGASTGAGLGIRFLKHIERTQALAFLIDLAGDNYLEAFDLLLQELEAFSPGLPQKKRIILGNKLDLEGTAERLEELRARYPQEEIVGISVYARQGLEDCAARFVELVKVEDGAEDMDLDRELMEEEAEEAGDSYTANGRLHGEMDFSGEEPEEP